ncbi:MAG: M20 family metallo-hydrolase [Rhodobacterales bacterium]|nr:M20 family metallo-hydrolase [Rhodobacterales bacterium]
MQEQARRAARAVDGAGQWDRLARLGAIGAIPGGGVCRLALTAEDMAARRLMLEWAAELDLEPATDAFGNLFLRLPGTRPEAPPVVSGSHLDTQPHGGRFDGAYGVVAALEAVRAMRKAGLTPRRPVDVVAWTNEEGSRFPPGTMGSMVFTGLTDLAHAAAIVDRDGVALGDALPAFLAATPDLPLRPFGTPMAAYVEAHIEQGPVLEAADEQVGVVTGIQGSRWFQVSVRGEDAHAGTTPPALRRDALRQACSMVDALHQVFDNGDDRVRFTVGRFDVDPGSPNTIAGGVDFTIDFRHPESAVIHALSVRVAPTCQGHAGPCGVSVRELRDVPPVSFDLDVIRLIDDMAAGLGYRYRRMNSGAGHDAEHLAHVCPTGMVFVPCRGGRSHTVTEDARPEDLAAGTAVLAASLTALSEAS